MRNPKRLKLESNWSKLCGDVLQMVLERLSPTDFKRAKAVCSSWLSASRDSVRKQTQTPWLILFPYERSYGYSCRMLNSDSAEKSFVYRSRNLGVEFTQSRCIATCGSWLLMYVPDRPKLYILNPLTRQRINLPSLESRQEDQRIMSSPEFTGALWQTDPTILVDALTPEVEDLTEERAVLWVDDKGKDYFVLWSHSQRCVFFSKNGDDFWTMLPFFRDGCTDLVFKAPMLYIFTLDLHLEAFNFSGDYPVVATRPMAYLFPRLMPGDYITRLAITPSGEILLVQAYDMHTTSCSFYIYQRNHATKKWENMPSLADQALIFDLGITVPTTDAPGLKADSIYISGPGFGTNHVFTFNLATRKVEPFVTSTRKKFFDSRWFIPSL